MVSGTKIADMTVGLHFDGSKMYVDMKQISKKVEAEAGDAGAKAGDKLSTKWAAATGAIAGITQTVFAKVTDTISQSMDRAIKRVDILNNFPRVMSNLGIAADASKEVVDDLADKLIGLPTALDDAAAAVQRFTSKNGDVKKSEKLFLAVNNAILAGGATADIQSSAIEQLSQAYAKGKPDMMEWRTLQTAMPAQLKQVATAMFENRDALEAYLKKAQDYSENNPMSSIGKELVEQLEAVKSGTGDMSTALGTALRAGVISMDEFIDTMVRMNKEGVDGLPNLEEQARNATGGIGTAMENVQNRVAAAIQKIIDAIGQENIATAINNISTAISKVGGVIAGVINFIKDNEVARDALIASLITLAGVIVSAVVPAFVAWGAALLANPITWIVLGVVALVTGLILLVTHIKEVGKFFGDVFGAIGKWVGEAVENVGKFFGMIGNWIGEAIENIGKFFVSVGKFIATLARNVWNFFVEVGRIFWNAIQPIVDFMRNIIIAVIAIFTNILTWIWDFFLSPLIEFFVSIGTSIYNFYAGVIGAIINALTGVMNWIIGVGTNIYNFVAGIIGSIMNVIGGIVGWISANVIAPIGSFFQGIFDWIANAASAVANFVAGIIGNIAGAIGAFGNKAKEIFEGIVNFVKNSFSAVGQFIGHVFETIGGIIKAPINGIIQGINGVLSFINSIKVPDWVPGIGGAHTDFGMIPLLASGGLVTGATQAIIGEAGSEVVLPLEQNTDNWSGLLAHALAEEMSNQGTDIGEPIYVTINNNINNELDAREIGQVMMESIRRAAA